MTCNHCKKVFEGIGGTKYCDECRKEIKAKQMREFRKKNKQLKVQNLTELLQRKAFTNVVTDFEEKIRTDYLRLKNNENITLLKFRLDILQNKGHGFTKNEIRNASKLKSKSQFDKFLKTCLELEALEHRNKMYYLTPKYIYEPLKTRHRRTIDGTPAERTYLDEHFLFYLPENIVFNDFKREDMIQINKTLEDFFISLRKILENIRRKKAEMIWLNEINNAEQVNPLVKLDMWACLLVEYLLHHSTAIFLSVTTKMVKIERETIPRETAIKIWKRKGESLRQEIFDDVLTRIWKNENLTEEQISQINICYKKEYTAGYLYCKEVWSKIAKTLQQQDYTFVINPFIEHGFGYHKEDTDENIEYLKSLPWFKYSFREEDKLMDALNYVRQMEVSNKMIETKEVERNGNKYQWEFKITDEKPLANPANLPSYFEIGKKYFDAFQSPLQKSLLCFCKNLGYKNKKQSIEIMGEFLGMFPGPDIPPAYNILTK